MKALVRNHHWGQSAFEFAMALPIFVSFVALGVDFGVMGWSYIAVANAVREGARYAATNCGGNCSASVDIPALVVKRSDGVIKNKTDVDVWWCQSGGASRTTPKRGDWVVVQATADYDFRFFPSASIPLKIKMDMLVELDDQQSAIPKSTGTASRPC